MYDKAITLVTIDVEYNETQQIPQFWNGSKVQ